MTMTLASYWRLYDATLARIRDEKPTTFEQLKSILDSFEPPSSAQAFFPDGADDTLMSAVKDAGWGIIWADAYYHYRARCQASGAQFEYVEGDLYDETAARSKPIPHGDPA
jgi:hypothetical protein